MAPRKSEQKRVAPARRKYMEELLQLREESGMSLGDLSERSTYDRSYLSKLERGERLGDLETAKRLDAVYGAKRTLQNLWHLAKEDVYLGRYQRFMELESEANVIQMYVPQTIPGLLQTEEYAREQLWSTPHRPDEEGRLEEQLVGRMSRRSILCNGDRHVHLRVILDEAALRRPLRDPVAWHRQLEQLLADARLPHVTVQVVPFSAGIHDLLGGTLTLLWLPEGAIAAYLESGKSGEVLEEPAEVEMLKLSYDQVRDLALSPSDSYEFIKSLSKDG
ncbi:helix-turn-helix transcriptional regulator [Streptomyces sp. 7-21]|uniref:helix-turn-helix domain-containing protein n=1 Tax=Streptomyces sp. 7-21 TaxID=2802283 RepID=UPI00191D9387|nr:helix-turn-helix transcriptional regulator [Streptomyces sp. 7-21]MBL1065151.1 helix-turn-helix transcriptional regulator [Streptomyces sp. 7-21]